VTTRPKPARPAGGAAPGGVARRNAARGAVRARTVPAWLPIITLLLSVAGLGISVYLTLTHYDPGAVPLACPSTSTFNCAAVTTGPWSMIFGVLPVAVLGLPFFVAMIALQSPPAWRSPLPLVRYLRLGSMVVGVGFVCFLIYTELFVANAICVWCSTVHAITLVLFVLTMVGAALAQPPAGGAAGARRPVGARGR
jgi:uncharacterized membrane protein